jgi:hypothetical protein
MSAYEALSIIISCIAALVSLVVWGGQRKLQREANDLQRATSELSKKQLEILQREEKGQNTARLSFALERDGNGFRFFLRNISDVDAKDIQLELLLERPEDNPLIKSDFNQKIPVKRLQPGESVSLMAALHLGSPTAFNARISWTNPNGLRVEEDTFSAL